MVHLVFHQAIAKTGGGVLWPVLFCFVSARRKSNQTFIIQICLLLCSCSCLCLPLSHSLSLYFFRRFMSPAFPRSFLRCSGNKYSTRLYSTLLYSTLIDSTLLYSTWRGHGAGDNASLQHCAPPLQSFCLLSFRGESPQGNLHITSLCGFLL